MGSAAGIDAAGIDAARRDRGASRRENFPVALRVLPATVRRDLRAVYAVARLIDDVGDDAGSPTEDRARELDRIESELRMAFAGGAVELPAVRALAPAIGDRRLPLEPFLALVEANRHDLRTSRYRSYGDLRHYCSLSADPVGRSVLAVFGVADPRAGSRSDQVCSALQILEHCQDVGEDRRDRDRIYLPGEDLDRFGVAETDLDAATATPRLRRLLAFEVDRAEALLADGAELVGMLHGAARIAVAGYVAGGRATVAAIRRAGHDVLGTQARPRRRDIAAHTARLLGGRR
ncbi:MAG TPA: squalene synthase HpnC [Mycobacteriales bacterium]|nr:squalene synthase HpnC [Mycobacteriales bacterium]